MSKETAQVRIRDAIDPPCPKHAAAEAIFVCLENGCGETLACLECIVEEGDHTRHSVALLKNHLGIFKKKINDFNINTREKVLTPLKKMVEEVSDELMAYDPGTTTLLEDIEARGDKINDRTNALVMEFKTKCSQLRASNRQVLEQHKTSVLAMITDVEADISSLDTCLKAECKKDIANAAKTGISKTYPASKYPDIKEVSFKESDDLLKNMEKLLGKIVIGNEQPVREELDDEKIKRLEAYIKDLKHKGEIDEKKITCLDIETMDIKQNNIEREKTDQARIQTLQANIDELNRKLQDQNKSLTDEIKDLKTRLPCSSCHQQEQSCVCKTCPKCHYKGNDFRHCGLRICPKCHPG